jgi:hypothetical protein
MGTSLAIHYPSPSVCLSSSSRENTGENHVIAMGCADGSRINRMGCQMVDGSILLLKSSVIIAKKNTLTGIIGDSFAAADSKQTVDKILFTTSKGHACVLSLSWHPYTQYNRHGTQQRWQHIHSFLFTME